MQLIEQLNYAKFIDNWNAHDFKYLHQARWEAPVTLGSFQLTKIHGDIFEAEIPKQLDIIYYDAFAPASQPELWEKKILSKIINNLNTSGILITYCSQGAFRRTLMELKMNVQKVPGPPGKREIVIAQKK